MDPKSAPCVFVGYSVSPYFCLDPNTYRIYTSRHVIFVEHVYPFHEAKHQVSNQEIPDQSHTIDILVLVTQPPPTNQIQAFMRPKIQTHNLIV